MFDFCITFVCTKVCKCSLHADHYENPADNYDLMVNTDSDRK